jgi:hypothetical protein
MDGTLTTRTMNSTPSARRPIAPKRARCRRDDDEGLAMRLMAEQADLVEAVLRCRGVQESRLMNRDDRADDEDHTASDGPS